ncbi:MAG: sorbosone dehydrogenase [Planctomycetaceae bacterium]|nr:sorbosone dehydrogenase [Planctomycetaceae bacterium]
MLAASTAFAQRDLTDIPDPDPMKQLEQLKVAEGFEINLFASDPDIAKPIHSNWDARGRLWVATSSVYPQLEPGEVANDKIVVLEDTTGDGKADKTTVFADGLLIPTGVLPAGNGAYVANSTELLFMEDTDGDGKADKSRVVLSGFGTEDTHHILHTLRRGPGGYVYFNQSIYIHSNIETPWGLKQLDGGGIWKFRPETLELDVWVRGFVNAWGHRFDDWGQEFATDGAYGEGVNYVFPGSAFVTAVGAERILHGMSPGQPKHCGLGILSGRHLPEDYRGTFVTNDFRGHRVNRFAVEESQSGYVARQLNDLVWTDHVAFRPIDVSMGPDGAIYVVDWYNPIIQHGEVDFRDPRRDKIHGRIWRVSAKGTPSLKKPQLTEASASELVAALKSPERWERDVARQLIGERGRKMMEPAIREFVTALNQSEASFERDRLEALWALQSVDVIDEPLLSAVLSSKDHHARAAGVRVLSDWSAEVADSRKRLADAVADEHPQVRLEAVNALRGVGDADAARLALTALDKPVDENLDYALWLTARELQSEWLPKVAEDPTYIGTVRRLVFALTAAGSSEALQPAIVLWDADDLSPDERNAVAGLLGRFGGPAELSRLATEKTLSNAAMRGAALAALLTAARERKVVPQGAANVAKLLEADDKSSLPAAAELMGLYRLEGGPSTLERLASSASGDVRQAALAGLVADGRPAARDALVRLAETDAAKSIRPQAVAMLARIDAKQAAKSAASLLSAGNSDAETTALTAAFLAVPGGSEALAQALKGQSLPEPVALAALRAVSTSARKADKLADAIREAGNLAPLEEELTSDQLLALVERVRTSGDPRRGESLYRRDDLQCVKCHAIGGGGGIVGPDVTSIGGSAQIDYLIESLLQPSKKIKEGYHTTTVVREDGTIASGVLVRKTDDEIVIRDNNAVEISIPMADVVEDAISPISLMPTGLTTKLRRDEIVDLVAFLSRLGKDDEYRVPAKRLVRTWQVLDASPEVGAAVRGNGIGALARTPEKFPWRSVTSNVAGELPINESPPVDFFNGQRFRVVRFGLTTSQAGSASIRVSNAEGVAGYVRGEPLPISSETKVELSAGTTPITFVLDESRFSDATLAIEVVDDSESPARPEPAKSF